MATVAKEDRVPPEMFLHEAFLYAGEADFVSRSARFIRAGVELGESVFVVVGARKIELLRSELGAEAEGVGFADMTVVGKNPARIIPAWRAFIDSLPTGSRARGIGEPIWSERSPDELVECERHEALLNIAFADDDQPWWLLCPYDTDTLESSVIEEAEKNHPMVLEAGVHRGAEAFRGLGSIREPFDPALPEPVLPLFERSFDVFDLPATRVFVAGHAASFGLTSSQTDDLVLAASELVSNSLRHGGGKGVLRTWRTDLSVICEVRDEGRLDDPLAGRRRPGSDQSSGFGLWIVNQLCDLVQVRTSPAGSTVRAHMSR